MPRPGELTPVLHVLPVRGVQSSDIAHIHSQETCIPVLSDQALGLLVRTDIVSTDRERETESERCTLASST